MCEVVTDKAMADRLQTWMTNVFEGKIGINMHDANGL
jgi:hypothetical protein